MGEASAASTGLPLWLGPPERPIAARLHIPAGGMARGAAVLCPAAGYEYTLAHRALLTLAQGLATAGLAALRLDYDGCGESWGDEEDPGRVTAWQESIPAAVARIRQLGARQVSLVGLRVGAVLAARAAREVDAAGLVLWDPIAGNRYARELAVTAAVQHNTAPAGALSVDGYVVTDETIDQLRRLRFPEPPPTVPTLALLRPEETMTASPTVTVRSVLGQPELFADDTLAAAVPTATIETIVTWLAARAPAASPLAEPDSTIVETAGVRERFLTVAGMACTESEPVDGARGGLPTVAMVNTILDPRIGPSRSWVGWSRKLAALGFRTVRADLTGIGDSAPPADAGPPAPYAPHLVLDVRRLVSALDDGHGVALVGLCSGARNALDAAADLPVTDLLLINPVLNERRADLEAIRAENADLLYEQSLTLKQRIRHGGAGRLPSPGWWLVHRLRLLEERTASLRRALATGAEVLLVYGADDFTRIKPPANARWAFDPLLRTGRLRVEAVEADHSMIDPIGRRNALAPLTEHLVDRYLGGSHSERESAALR